MSPRIDCVLPYQEAALLAEAHKTSTITTEDYVEDGTRLVAYVPPSLRNRIERACAQAGTAFADEAPKLASRARRGTGDKSAKALSKRKRAVAQRTRHGLVQRGQSESELNVCAARRARPGAKRAVARWRARALADEPWREHRAKVLCQALLRVESNGDMAGLVG